MFKNVASQSIQLFAFDTATNLPKTGDAANITAYVSKDHGTVTVLADTSAAEMDATNAPGVYVFGLAQGETNADELTFSAKSSTSGIRIVPRFVTTTPTDIAAIKAKTDNLPSDPADASVVAGLIAAAEAKIDTIDTVVDAILVDTAEIGAAGAGLTALASAANLATVAGYLDTEVAAIKAKTDNLPSDPADASVVAGLIAAAEAKIDTVDTVVDAIKAKTDSLTFTQTGHVDANVQRVNDVLVTGDGETGTEWGPA
jgi:hypothetical protein